MRGALFGRAESRAELSSGTPRVGATMKESGSILVRTVPLDHTKDLET